MQSTELLPPPTHETNALTARQFQILDAFARGYKTEDVAEAIGLSTETIRTHMKRILAKLDAKTRAHACYIYGAGKVTCEDAGMVAGEGSDVSDR